MSKHTPGPWTVNQGGGASVVYPDNGRLAPITIEHFLIRENGQPKLFLYHDRELLAESQANAALVAAAPDLLAACKLVLKVPDRWEAPPQPWIDAVEAVKSAIARAESKEAA